jgi:cell division protein FtsQ
MAPVTKPGRVRAAVLPLPRVRRLGDFSFSSLLPSGRALLVGFALLGAGVLAYFGARESSLFALRSIEISGAPPRVAAHVRTALRPLDGKSLLAVDRADVERRLAKLSDVAGVSFDRDFPHTLKLNVTPAHSIAVLRRGMSAWILSSDGHVIRTTGLFGAPRLPRVWVPRATSIDVGMTIDDADAARAVAALALARGARFEERIATVRSSGSELTFVLANGPELRLGDPGAVGLKLAVAERLLPMVITTAGYVDVSVPARPIVGGQPSSRR